MHAEQLTHTRSTDTIVITQGLTKERIMLATKRFIKAKTLLQAATKLQVEMTQIDALIFIYNAGRSGARLTDMAEATGVSISAAGRTAATFSIQGYKGAKMKGWGLAETFIDYNFPAFKMVRLTPKGIAVIEEFLKVLTSD